MYDYVICDHMRALHVYMRALNGSCPLMGIPCNSYEEFLNGQCLNCDIFKGKCPTIGQEKTPPQGVNMHTQSVKPDRSVVCFQDYQKTVG